MSPSLTVQGFGLLVHNLLGRLTDVASNSHNAVAGLRVADGVDPDSKAAFAEHRAKKDFRGTTNQFIRRVLDCIGGSGLAW